jgi:hypothetical protein
MGEENCHPNMNSFCGRICAGTDVLLLLLQVQIVLCDSISSSGKTFFSSAKHAGCLCGPPSQLPSEYQE